MLQKFSFLLVESFSLMVQDHKFVLASVPSSKH